ncbi:MAG: hypothetical protein KAI72_05560, partial [Candidatus Pacebacteria bacterium]|nr:hypothetical protein [Candidatus Paceibacterota bacterium]
RLGIGYKESTGMLLKDIAKEFGVHKTFLQRYTQFYTEFKNGYPEKYHNYVVRWVYICCVLPVRGKRARDFYLKEACRYRWSRFDLRDRIKEGYYEAMRDASVSNKSKTLKPKAQRLYTYAAEVIKVVDGDTLDLEIDVGFKAKHEHRVRFRGIDCPEIGTPKGKKAKEFVEEELNKCVIEQPLFKGSRASRPLVVIKTFKCGMYGRYIVDLYYLPTEKDPEMIVEKGKLLNQVLIDKGLARKV